MSEKKFDSGLAEKFAKWYLRLNGYFSVDNFIVHAGDDPRRISKGFIGNYTETDILAIRYRYSKEVTGTLEIANDSKIISPTNPKIDFVIVEVKTGSEDKPNKIWQNKQIDTIIYILRFAGFIERENQLNVIANILAVDGKYDDAEGNFSIRLVLISEKHLNRNWQYLTNILIDEIIDFFVEVRGQCWINENIGIASIHYQWDDLINKIFSIANDMTISIDDKKDSIKNLLQE